jgi:hypothetical protein
MVERADFRSYYGRPVLKPPVWKPEIPLYFFVGGLAGASAGLAFAAEVAGNEPLAQRARTVTLAAGTVSPVLLTSDLGRPERFLNMLRVFKPTSPMSVGSWVVSGMGGSVGIAATSELLGVVPRAGRAARAASALLGLPMATYTATLIANTAVPVWHEARHALPFVFAAGAATSAGAAATALTPAEWAGPARRLAIGGAVAELVATTVMERRLGELGEPYHHGAAGRFNRLSKALSAAGAATLAAAGRARAGAVGGSLALLAGGVCLRWSVFLAGRASAEDPKYTVKPQRERVSGAGSPPSSAEPRLIDVA